MTQRGTGARRAAPSREILALTGLRAVAATWVVLLHFERFLTPYLDHVPALRSVIAAGMIGVDLFFILSGFVIAHSYLEKCGSRFRPSVVGRFVYARVARVWPAWALVTVLMGALVWAGRRAELDTEVLIPHPDASLVVLLQQLSMTHLWGADTFVGASYVLPGWSISAEWAAYLVFPFAATAFYALRRLPAAVLFAAALLALSPTVVDSFVNGTVDGAVPWWLRIACCFSSGVLTCLAVRKIGPSPRVERGATVASVVAVVGVVVVSLWASWRRGGDPTVDYSLVAVAWFPVLIASLALTDKGPAKFLAMPSMVYGGRISYCLYLVHYALLDVTVVALWQRPGSQWVLTPGLVLLMPALVLVSFGCAALLYHGVEEPGRRLLMSWWPSERTPLARTQPSSTTTPVTVVPAPRATALAHVPPRAANGSERAAAVSGDPRRERRAAAGPATSPSDGEQLARSTADERRAAAAL